MNNLFKKILTLSLGLTAVVFAHAAPIIDVNWYDSVAFNWTSKNTSECFSGDIVTGTGKTLARPPGGILGLVPGDPGPISPKMTVNFTPGQSYGTAYGGQIIIGNASFPVLEDGVLRNSYTYNITIRCRTPDDTIIYDTQTIRVNLNNNIPYGGILYSPQPNGTNLHAPNTTGPLNVNGSSNKVRLCARFFDDSRDLNSISFVWQKPDGTYSNTSSSDNDLMTVTDDSGNNISPTATFNSPTNEATFCANFSPSYAGGAYRIFAVGSDKLTPGSGANTPTMTITTGCEGNYYPVNGACSEYRPPNASAFIGQSSSDPSNIVSFSCSNSSVMRLVTGHKNGANKTWNFLYGSYTGNTTSLNNSRASAWAQGPSGVTSSGANIPPAPSAGQFNVNTSLVDLDAAIMCDNINLLGEPVTGTMAYWSLPKITVSQAPQDNGSPAGVINASCRTHSLPASPRWFKVTKTVNGVSQDISGGIRSGMTEGEGFEITGSTIIPGTGPTLADTSPEIGVPVTYTVECWSGEKNGANNSPTGILLAKNSVTQTFTCPPPRRTVGSQCLPANNNPIITISPTTISNAIVGQPITFTSQATDNDNGGDIINHAITWMSPRMHILGINNYTSDTDNDEATISGNGIKSYSTPVSTSDMSMQFTPTKSGLFGVSFGAKDFTSQEWKVESERVFFTASCPVGYIESNGTCTNPRPNLNITPYNATIALGQSVTFTSSASDSSGDLTVHKLSWQNPNGTYDYQDNSQAQTTYSQPTDFLPKGSSANMQAEFNPKNEGVYKVRFAAADDWVNNFSGYFTPNGRWTFSDEATITVIKKVNATIIENPTDKNQFLWECAFADRATLTKTIAGVTTSVFTNQSVPPSSGIITKEPNASYKLTCFSGTGESVTTFTQATVTAENITQNTADILFNCNNTQAKSVAITRVTDGGYTRVLAGPTGTISDANLTPNKLYTFRATCYDGPIINNLPSGNLVSSGSGSFTTSSSGPTSSIVIETAILATASSPLNYSTNLLSQTSTSDGSFYIWTYRVTGGTPTSCELFERNDNQSFTSIGAGNISTQTGVYTTLYPSAQLRKNFVDSFSQSHTWRVTCTDASGGKTTRDWRVNKQSNPPQVTAVTCNKTSGQTPTYYLTIGCDSNTTGYRIENSGGQTVSSGAYSGTFNVNIPQGTYRIYCTNGSAQSVPTNRLCNASVFDPGFDLLNASPRSIKKGGLTTLTWNINSPDNKCKIIAIPTKSDAGGPRDQEAAALTEQLTNGYTDQNDPSGSRLMSQALEVPLLLETKSRGKKTLSLNTSMIFIGSCKDSALTDSTALRVRVQVINENEG